MNATDPIELLRRYAEQGSESAFHEIVQRFIALVHSVAVRRVGGDVQLAEDITQTVFADLARQARRPKFALLKGPVGLGGWLHRHTCFVASNHRRAQQRRQNRKSIAAEMNPSDQPGEPAWREVAPVLDEALQEPATEWRQWGRT